MVTRAQDVSSSGEDRLFFTIVCIIVALAGIDMLVTLLQSQATNLLTLVVFSIVALCRWLAGYFIVAGQQWFLFALVYVACAWGIAACWKKEADWGKKAAVVFGLVLLIPLFPVKWVALLAWKL